MQDAPLAGPPRADGGLDPEATGVVFCGGTSSRMGTDKARLRLGDASLLERAVECLRGVASECLLASGEHPSYPELGLRCALDDRASYGAGGALLGLEAALREAHTEWVCALACDMPRARPELFRALLAKAREEQADVCLLEGEKGPEPLFAVYRTTCLAPVREALAAGQRRMVSFHALELTGDGARRPVRVASVELGRDTRRAATNLNTPHELARERETWGQENRPGVSA